MTPKPNTIKCKYCNYTCSRFKGRNRYQGQKLLIHVEEEHKQEFLKATGCKNLSDYMDRVEAETYLPFTELGSL